MVLVNTRVISCVCARCYERGSYIVLVHTPNAVDINKKRNSHMHSQRLDFLESLHQQSANTHSLLTHQLTHPPTVSRRQKRVNQPSYEIYTHASSHKLTLAPTISRRQKRVNQHSDEIFTHASSTAWGTQPRLRSSGRRLQRSTRRGRVTSTSSSTHCTFQAWSSCPAVAREEEHVCDNATRMRW
jgi:hypothetical protein